MITLATLHEYSAQQVFDYISNHLLTQGEKCQEIDDIGDGPSCKYRNSDKQSCAAGCLIGPMEYTMDFEGKDWGTHVNDGRVPDVHHGLISSMQKVHDTCNADNWYEGLLDVARIYGFSTFKLDQYARENNYCIFDK